MRKVRVLRFHSLRDFRRRSFLAFGSDGFAKIAVPKQLSASSHNYLSWIFRHHKKIIVPGKKSGGNFLCPRKLKIYQKKIKLRACRRASRAALPRTGFQETFLPFRLRAFCRRTLRPCKLCLRCCEGARTSRSRSCGKARRARP